jgi:hypothetical protein
MSDLASGRYPDSYTEWLLDGQPSQPYRTSISRGDVSSGTTGFSPAANATNSAGAMYVVAVPVQAGDIIGAISVGVNGAAVGPTHAWAALYNGMTSSATLLAQSTDTTSTAIGAGALKFTLPSAQLVGGVPGTAQAAANTGGPSGPSVYGVALFFTASTSIPTLDAMLGGNVSTVSGLLTGQLPLVAKAGSSLTGTAPSTLSGLATPSTSTYGIPYVNLSRS